MSGAVVLSFPDREFLKVRRADARAVSGAVVLSFPDRLFLKVRRADAAEAPGRRRMVCPSCLRLVNVQRGVIVGHSIGGVRLCAASWLSRWSPDLRAVRAPGPLAARAEFP